MKFANAVVTGATGHLGNVLVRELLASGRHVRVLALEGEDLKPLAGLDVEVVRGNVSDVDSLERAFTGSEVVFHLAGVIAIAPGAEEALQRINVDGTRNVVEASLRTGVKRLVYTSSVHALTEPSHRGVLDETAGFNPAEAYGDYGKSKAAASVAVLDAVKSGLDAVMICPVGVIGPYDFKRSEMGYMFISYSRGELPAIIDGSYDFVDVRDVARGHILAAERGGTGEAYIVSGGRVTIQELLEMLAEITGRPHKIPRIPIPLARIAAVFAPLYAKLTGTKALLTETSIHTLTTPYSICDDKARRELGYRSLGIQDSISDALDWYREAGYLYRSAPAPSTYARMKKTALAYLRDKFPMPSRELA